MGAGKEPDDILIRRVLFSVLVTVIVGVGAWFVIDAVRRSPESGPVIMAREGRYTVKMMHISAAGNVAKGEEFARRALKEMAVRMKIFPVELSGGGAAVCAGRFARTDSPEAVEMLQKCRGFALDSGEKPFEQAEVIEVQ